MRDDIRVLNALTHWRFSLEMFKFNVGIQMLRWRRSKNAVKNKSSNFEKLWSPSVLMDGVFLSEE